MPLTQCAVWYWKNTGAKAGSILLDDDSQYAALLQGFAAAHPDRVMFLTAAVPNEIGVGCPDPDTCRQLIAKERGLPVVPEQFTAQIDAAGNVVVIHADTDPSIDPGSVGAPKDHALASAPAQAIIGDLYDAKAAVFSRRYVIADSTTKNIAAVQIVPLDSEPVLSATEFAVASTSLDVGQIAPAPKTEIAVASIDTPA